MKVIMKQTSNDGKATPTEIKWSEGDELSVMRSVANLLDHARDDSPWAPRILEVRIEF